jgi:CYTH domain-containing protein
MPTEHEYKTALSVDLCEKTVSKKAREHQRIEQGYLAFSKGMTARIRFIDDGKKTKWYLTFKQKVGERVIEIEKKIDERDGQDLWSVCVGKLKKDRYVVDNKGVVWEVDFFKKGNHLYFVLAEVELPEGATRPKSVPEILKPHVLYEVPLTDDRFSNKRLGDVDYAMELYRKINEGVIDENDENDKEPEDL